MKRGLTEQEKATLRNAQEIITSEIRSVMDIYSRLDEAREYDFGVRLVKDSLHYCRQYLNDARLVIDDALTHNRDYLEEE